MNRKWTAMMMILLISLGMLAGCSDATTPSQYVGTWKVSRAARNGEEYDAREFSDIIMILSKGGSATITIDGNNQPATWEQTREGVDVTFGGGAVWRMSGLSPTLRMVIEDGENRIDLTFRKEQ